MATKRVALGNKGGSKQSMHPTPDFSPCTTNSSSAKRSGAECKKNRRGSSLMPAGPAEGLGEVAVEAASEAPAPFLPSASSMAFLPLQAATAGSSDEEPSLLEAASPLSEGMEKEELQREHSGESVGAAQAHNHNRPTASAAGIASEVEPIELDEITADEVVDLTGDSAESVVVDLTHNDSVMIVEEDREWQNGELRNQQLPASLILSSDDDSELKESHELVTSKDRSASSRPSGTVSCPICLEGYSEIVHSGRHIVSTKCGHIFCSQCLCNSLRNTRSCPTCRKKLSHRQYHPVYI